jgi:ParB family chromosome partitioning protein
MAKKTGLGRGLDALIPGGEPEQPAAGAITLLLDQISPNPRQPRHRFDQEELDELAASIREHGVIQPLIVTQVEGLQAYTLIAGERRLIAARLAGLDRVPVIVREASGEQLLELALVENVQRADLGALEAAEAYRQLAEDFGLSHEEIARRVGKSRVAVTNTLRLLKLPETVQKALAEQRISEGHGRALLALSTPHTQAAALQTILRHELNVRQTEDLVRRLSGEKTPLPVKPAPPAEVSALEQRLQTSLGTRVNLNHRRKGGTITIHYYSDEELNVLVERLLGEELD